MFNTLKNEFSKALDELLTQVNLKHQHLMVIGCSTSEILGQRIGTAGSTEVAQALWEIVQQKKKTYNIDIAVQCCEHLNRALVVERETLDKYRLREVAAVPVPQAGGAFAAYVYRQLQEPCLAENIKADFGIDIGETFISMHLRPVVVPLRLSVKKIGDAHLMAATTRPPLIGGERAQYSL